MPKALETFWRVWHDKGGDCLGTPWTPYNLSEKYWRYTSNFYRSTSPICKVVPRWLQSFGERETPQYTYCSTPPICTAIRLAFVPAILLRKYQWMGGPESPERGFRNLRVRYLQLAMRDPNHKPNSSQ